MFLSLFFISRLCRFCYMYILYSQTCNTFLKFLVKKCLRTCLITRQALQYRRRIFDRDKVYDVLIIIVRWSSKLSIRLLKGQVTFLKLYLLVVCLALIIPRFTLFWWTTVFRPKYAFVCLCQRSSSFWYYNQKPSPL